MMGFLQKIIATRSCRFLPRNQKHFENADLEDKLKKESVSIDKTFTMNDTSKELPEIAGHLVNKKDQQ